MIRILVPVSLSLKKLLCFVFQLTSLNFSEIYTKFGKFLVATLVEKYSLRKTKQKNDKLMKISLEENQNLT